MIRSGIRPVADRSAIDLLRAFGPALAPAPIPTRIELSLEHGRDPSFAQVQGRESLTVRPGAVS